MSQQSVQAKTVFDVAKVIAEELKQLPDRQQQEQAIRYASDSLGLAAPLHSPLPSSQSGQSGVQLPAQPTDAPQRTMDIRTFTADKAPKNDIQFAAVAAYYYRFLAPGQERKEAIDGNDLQDAARKADRRRPGHAAQTLRNAKNAGYLDSAGTGRFSINAVGENLVAVTLPGGSSEVAGTHGASRPKWKKRAARENAGSNKRARRGR